MQKALRASSLVPPGFAVMGTENEDGKTLIVVRSTARASPCPSCGAGSRQIHSHYQRQIGDLPIAGRSVHLVAFVRRFRCLAVRCAQGIFAERLMTIGRDNLTKAETLTVAAVETGVPTLV